MTLETRGEPRARRIKTTVLTDLGPVRISGGEMPYHVTLFAEMYVYRVTYEVTAVYMLWPDRHFDCAPDANGEPSAVECVTIRRIGGGASASARAQERIRQALNAAAAQIETDFMRESNRAWGANASHGIRSRIRMLEAMITNLRRDLAPYEDEEHWYL